MEMLETDLHQLFESNIGTFLDSRYLKVAMMLDHKKQRTLRLNFLNPGGALGVHGDGLRDMTLAG